MNQDFNRSRGRLRKFTSFPVLVLVALTIGFVAAKTPPMLEILTVVVAVLFAINSAIHFYWAARPVGAGGYRWSALERAGSAVSGFAALLITTKLVFQDHLPGPYLLYYGIAVFLAFVVRPMLDNAGYKAHHGE